MRSFGALLRIVVGTLFYAVGGALYGFAFGLVLGAAIGTVVGLPLIFFDVLAPFRGLVGGLILVSMAGLASGFLAFTGAGLWQGTVAEFDFQNRLSLDVRLEKCIEAAFGAATLGACGGAITGALVGMACELLTSGSILGEVLAVRFWGSWAFVSATYQHAALLGAGIGYACGLFLGALAPDVVEKARERGRVWYENWRAVRQRQK